MTSKILSDALAIGTQWLNEIDVVRLTEQRLDEAGLLDAHLSVDVVAIGKTSREMGDAAAIVLGQQLRRRLTICDEESASLGERTADVVVGEHPIPGPGSLAAGVALLTFLDQATTADCTLFLVSGGASSLCVAPEPPLTLEDLGGVWNAALRSGVDITVLNKLRASTSVIAGGGVLRHVRTPRSLSLIMVDNVVSGPAWVASGLTYDFRPAAGDVAGLLEQVGLDETSLGEKLMEASSHRALAMTGVATNHENVILAQPSMMLEAARREATRRVFRVVDMGSQVNGNVRDVSEQWAEILRTAVPLDEPLALIGVGEVTVKVRGTGTGGRCQEFAWFMAGELAESERDGVFLARASDGRDFVQGVAGAWVDCSTVERAADDGIDWTSIAESNDSHTALRALDQLLDGGHSGWNLCDLYVLLVD